MIDAATIGMAIYIADEAARSDIETLCAIHATVTEGDRILSTWYDTSLPNDIDLDRAPVDQALTYLQARGLLVRRLSAPHIVTFVKSWSVPGGSPVYDAGFRCRLVRSNSAWHHVARQDVSDDGRELRQKWPVVERIFATEVDHPNRSQPCH